MTRTVAVIQARLGSTRLPGKVLLDLAGEPMLARVVERVRRVRSVDDLVVATTNLPRDDILERLCSERGWACVRGSEQDVLDRYHQAARETDADVVIRVTSDCPLLSPSVLDLVLRRFQEGPHVDYASNTLEPRTYPRGLDVEVFTTQALDRAWDEDQDSAWREHVTPYLYRSGAFRLRRVAHERDLSDHRWTVDTPEDYALARAVYAALPPDFDWEEVLALLENRQDLALLNRHVPQKKVPSGSF